MRLFALILVLITAPAFAQTLTRVAQFGSNPGDLEMLVHIPKKLARTPGMIVALHGCAQGAVDVAAPGGLVQLAEKKGFYLLLPQQKAANNNFRCFNWFQPTDYSREKGEAASIFSMIDYMSREYTIDGQKLYLVGFSAGAAMASSLLANYPEVFKGVAIIAGVPHGCGTNMGNAFLCMYATVGAGTTPAERARLVMQSAGNFTGPWPQVLIIHGTSDEVVNFKNAGFLIDQWTAVHKISNTPSSTENLGTHNVQDFKAANGKTVVKAIIIPNMKHGIPVNPSAGCGRAQSYILDAKICGAEMIGEYFALKDLR